VSTRRLIELDVLRVVAILFILIGHEGAGLDKLFPLFPIWFFGLSLFLFISGYVIQRNNPLIDSRNKAMNFLKKRVLRIYPLYWLALAAFFALGIGSEYTPQTISTAIIEICGAQGLLAPRFLPIPTITLWFVGVILLYYLVYLSIAPFSCDAKQMALAMTGVFVFFVIVRITLGIIDFRFFAYYGLFVAGVVASKYNMLYRADVKRLHTGLAVLLFVIAMVVIAASFHFATPTLSNIYDILSTINNAQVINFSSSMVLVIVLYTALALVFIYATVSIARLVVPSLSKNEWKLVIALSFSSYAVYLFHRPFYYVLSNSVVGIFHLSAVSVVTIYIVFVLGLPLLFLLCYVIQSTENDLVAWIKMRKQNSTAGLEGRLGGAEHREKDH
jgi:peptidoglycan/LPS O-acetylase OafA/YrhL